MKWIFCIAISLLVCLSFVSARIGISIDVKQSFGEGEIVSFQYTLTSSERVQIGYTPYIQCSKAPQELMQYKTVLLQPGIPFTSTYESFDVNPSIEPQSCTAYVQILDPVSNKVERKFTLQTRPVLKLKLFLCKDIACAIPTKVFVQGEKVFIVPQSDVIGTLFDGTLSVPGGDSRSIALPTSFIPESAGTYTVHMTAMRPGYQQGIISEQFAVISENAEVAFIGASVGDEGGQDVQTADTTNAGAGSGAVETKTLALILVILILVLIIVVLVVYVVRNNLKNRVVNGEPGAGI